MLLEKRWHFVVGDRGVTITEERLFTRSYQRSVHSHPRLFQRFCSVVKGVNSRGIDWHTCPPLVHWIHEPRFVQTHLIHLQVIFHRESRSQLVVFQKCIIHRVISILLLMVATFE